MYDAPTTDWITRQSRRPLPLFTADDLREVETACKATCREQWKGAVLIGVLIGFAMASTVSVLLRW